MGVRITSMEGKAALYDSTSGVAFGPIFDDGLEASEFLSWLETVNSHDAREIPEKELIALAARFEEVLRLATSVLRDSITC